MIRAAVQNPIAGLTLDKRLERNRAQIIYDIKKNIAIGLTRGDSYTTVAKRIAKSVNNDYTKAMLITRTETCRVREQGFEESARAAQNDLMGTGYVMSKTWRSMQDGSVRHTGDANHVKMHGVTVLADEYFELVGGVKAFSPGMSGTPQNDCNCRCYASRDFMSAKEFEKKTGRVLPEKYHKRKAESEATEQEQSVVQDVNKNDLDIAGESGIIIGESAVPVSIRFLNSSDDLFKYAKNIRAIDGYEDIVIHGDTLGFCYYDKNWKQHSLSVREFADILRNMDTYHGGNIRLISCETGADGALTAQALANQLGVDVMAPSNIVWGMPDGTMTIGDRPTDNDGGWRVFKPKR